MIKLLTLRCLVIGAVLMAAPSFAQVDHDASRKLARQINWFRITHLRTPIKYRQDQQPVLDSLSRIVPGAEKHFHFSKDQIGEVYMGYGKGVRGWKHSKGHRMILLNRYARYTCVGIFKDSNGEYWSIARTYK